MWYEIVITALPNIESFPCISVWYTIIGAKIKINTPNNIGYFRIVNFSFLNLTKNIMLIIKNKICPSPLIRDVSAAKTNERYTNFLSELRKRTKVNVENKIYIGSIIPNIEFWINLGSNAKINAPITEYFGSKNFLTKK